MVKGYFSRIFDIIKKPEMKFLPGQLAYFLILSIFPLLTLVGYILSKITLLSSNGLITISTFLPESVTSVLIPFLSGNNITDNVNWVMIIGFIIVSNGTYSIIVTSNEVYGIRDGDYLKERVKALFMIFILLFLFVFILIVLAYGNILLEYILKLKFLTKLKNDIYLIFLLLRWPISFLLFFAILKVLYTLAPDKKISSKYMNKGALFTTVGWILATLIYSYYVTMIADYTVFYGSLSGIIIMMIWIYVLSFIFVMGIAINAEDYLNCKKMNKKKKIEETI